MKIKILILNIYNNSISIIFELCKSVSVFSKSLNNDALIYITKIIIAKAMEFPFDYFKGSTKGQ